MPALPVPTLDHVVINVRDRIEEGHDAYRRLGFTLTPRGYHTLGSMNHLAIFGTDYLELIAAPANEARRREILEAPPGLNGIVFGTEDSAAACEALRGAGLDAGAPEEFSRPVELAGGARRDATFRTVRVPQHIIPGGRLYFCHHLTRDLVWRDEWRRHPNGAVGVARATIVSEAPERVAGLFRAMFGDGAVRGNEVLLGTSTIEIVAPETLYTRWGGAAPAAEGRGTYMAGLTFRTIALERAAAALRSGHVPFESASGRVVVPASHAFNATLEFVP